MDIKYINIVSETMRLEDWWTDLLLHTESFTKKEHNKLLAIERTIDRMWKRHNTFKNNKILNKLT